LKLRQNAPKNVDEPFDPLDTATNVFSIHVVELSLVET